MSITKSTIAAERWRDIACRLSDALEEWLLYGGDETESRAALASFQAAADEDDPDE